MRGSASYSISKSRSRYIIEVSSFSNAYFLG